MTSRSAQETILTQRPPHLWDWTLKSWMPADFCLICRNPCPSRLSRTLLFVRERLSFVLRGIPNGNTHYLEVCTEEQILHADEIAGRIGTL